MPLGISRGARKKILFAYKIVFTHGCERRDSVAVGFIQSKHNIRKLFIGKMRKKQFKLFVGEALNFSGDDT